jgi:hypothetical protein
MSILDTIQVPDDEPIICTIIGEAGRGKTSLGATFPKPVFIRAEDGLSAISKDLRPNAFPLLTDLEMLWDQLKALITEEHNYKTLVIDSVTTLEPMFTKHVIDEDNITRQKEGKKEISNIIQACGGYTAGQRAVGALHWRVRKAAEVLRRKKGMHVVFLAHADTEEIPSPDMEKYLRYTLRMQKHSYPPYIDDVDLVGFLRLETFLKSGDSEKATKKAVSNGKRIIQCAATSSSVCKNRYGIEEDLVFEKGKNPFLGYIDSLTKNKGK